MLENLTHKDFAPCLGDVFHLTLDAEQMLTMELVEVAPILLRTSTQPRWREAAPLSRTPFSIVFRGPNTHLLPQHMYTLTHERLGTIEGLFLVPIDSDERGYYYEASFT